VAEYRVRFFTPSAEVDLCGHATIATFSAMLQSGRVMPGQIHQETKAGRLSLELTADGGVIMEQAKPAFYEMPDEEEVLRSLGLSLSAKHENLPIQVVSTGLRDLFIPLQSAAHLSGIKADFARIKEISRKLDVTGYHVFTLEAPEGYDAACRNFAPLYDIPEESATGTSSGALAAYLWKHKVTEATRMCFIQGVDMGSPSEIHAKIEVTGDEISEVWVGGKAQLKGSKEIEL
jgi:PhzF family phenazine biosynthesis protein